MLNKKYIHSLTIIVLIVLSALLSVNKMQGIVNVMFLFVCVFLILVDRKLLYFIYIALLPTNGLISTEYNLFEYLHVSYIIHLSTTLALLLDYQKFYRAIATISEDNRLGVRRIAFSFAIFLSLFLILSEYKYYFTGIQDISTNLLINRTIRHILMFLPIVIIVKFSSIEWIRSLILRGFIASGLIISVSTLFSEQVELIGFATQSSYEVEGISSQDVYIRRAGVFVSLGDINSAAGFLNIFLGFILFLSTHFLKGYHKLILTLIIFAALIAFGSRTAAVGTIIIFLLFIFSSNYAPLQKTALVLLFISILGITTLNILNPVLDRFAMLHMGEGHLDPNYEFGRIGGWIFYLDFIISDIKIFLFGTSESIYKGYTSFGSTERVAHNFFIQTIYFWGIGGLIILISLIYKFVKFINRANKKSRLLALFIPFLLTLMFTSDTAIFLGIVVALAALPMNEARKSIKSSNGVSFANSKYSIK